MIFLYLLRNLLIVIIGILLAYILLLLNIYFNINTHEISDFYIILFENKYINMLIIFFLYIIIYFFVSLINYLISNKRFINYYAFIIALLISAFHYYIMHLNNVNVTIENFISLISIEIFLSFFINYSTKYENSI